MDDVIMPDSPAAPIGPDDAFAASVALLRDMAGGAVTDDRIVRLYTPAPTLALSRRESRMPGFGAAVEAAAARGFTTGIRPTGGRAVAYDPSCLVFDLVCRDDDPLGQQPLFERAGRAVARALRSFGVDARVGAVPHEYCPGEFSINARGAVKLVGTSQRAVKNARLLSGMVAFGPVDVLADVVADANSALDLDWDRRTFGTLHDEAPGVSRTAVADALARELLAS